ncbi:MAG TPA: hypothetical protein VHE78_18255 [Gemmatimonadaceae bacterium]|nr:hypothetical protein [Gemmatimonadaceae bacterium]
MANDFCAPLSTCDNLDGRVIFQRTAYGPTLASDSQPLPFGELALRGAAVRPYVDLHFEVRWVPKELCYGPVASIMTLAPGETVTIATRSEHRTTFTDLVRNAADSSSVSTHTRNGPDAGQSAASGVRSIADSQQAAANAMRDRADALQGQKRQDTVELKAMYAKQYGSFWSDLGDGLLAVATGGASLVAKGAAQAVSDLTKHAVGSAGNVGAMVGATMTAIAQVMDSVSRNESQSHLSESTHSMEDTTSTSVTRTFTNPYRDRTMQLRFIPVFRHFEVVTSIASGRLGLAMICGHLDFSVRNVGSRYAHVLGSAINEPTLLRLAQADVGVRAPDFQATSGELEDHLQANAGIYTKRFLQATVRARDEETVHGAFATLIARSGVPAPATQAFLMRPAGLSSSAIGAGAPGAPPPSAAPGDQGDVAAGLAWSQSEARANVLHVPLAAAADVRSAWKLGGAESANLVGAISQLAPPALGAIIGTPPAQTIHVYAGSHIEAVPGECVLPNIVTDALNVPKAQ